MGLPVRLPGDPARLACPAAGCRIAETLGSASTSETYCVWMRTCRGPRRTRGPGSSRRPPAARCRLSPPAAGAAAAPRRGRSPPPRRFRAGRSASDSGRSRSRWLGTICITPTAPMPRDLVVVPAALLPGDRLGEGGWDAVLVGDRSDLSPRHAFLGRTDRRLPPLPRSGSGRRAGRRHGGRGDLIRCGHLACGGGCGVVVVVVVWIGLALGDGGNAGVVRGNRTGRIGRGRAAGGRCDRAAGTRGEGPGAGGRQGPRRNPQDPTGHQLAPVTRCHWLQLSPRH